VSGLSSEGVDRQIMPHWGSWKVRQPFFMLTRLLEGPK
jgi:hypothetical protein